MTRYSLLIALCTIIASGFMFVSPVLAGPGVGLVPGEHQLLDGPTRFYVRASSSLGGQVPVAITVDFSREDWPTQLRDKSSAAGSSGMTASTDEQLGLYARAMREAWDKCDSVRPANPDAWDGIPTGMEIYLAGGLSRGLDDNPYKRCADSLAPDPDPPDEEPEPEPEPTPEPEPDEPESLCERCARIGRYGHSSCSPCPENLTPGENEAPYCDDSGEPPIEPPADEWTCRVVETSTGAMTIHVERRDR